MTSPAEEPVGVLAVDDHAIFLDVAREVVTATPGFRWVGGAGSGEEGLREVEARSPDLVLLDMRMPGMDGLETARRITAGHPDVVVVLVSIDEGSAIGAAIESSGAAALVRKQEFGPKLLRRLWQRHGGGASRRRGQGSYPPPTYPARRPS
jgi:two-component system, NarL family, invasion response regulator UvrY